jgi:hypothetical protein
MILTQEQLKYMFDNNSHVLEPVLNIHEDLIGFNVIKGVWQSTNDLGINLYNHYSVFYAYEDYIKMIKEEFN